jgi:hypothetical protein
MVKTEECPRDTCKIKNSKVLCCKVIKSGDGYVTCQITSLKEDDNE